LLKSGQIAPGFVIDSELKIFRTSRTAVCKIFSYFLSGLDPLILGDFELNKGFNMKLSNMQAIGFSTFKIEKARATVEKFKLEFIMSVPKISTKAFYNLNWKLGFLNLQGRGDTYSYLGR
jgi:hypothetical protein